MENQESDEVEQAVTANARLRALAREWGYFLAQLHTPEPVFKFSSKPQDHWDTSKCHSCFGWGNQLPRRAMRGRKAAAGQCIVLDHTHVRAARGREPNIQQALLLGCQCSQIQENAHKTSSKPSPLCSN